MIPNVTFTPTALTAMVLTELPTYQFVHYLKKYKLMAFIVIETFGGANYATIVTNEDGENMIFNTREEAQAEADDCQDGIVVEI